MSLIIFMVVFFWPVQSTIHMYPFFHFKCITPELRIGYARFVRNMNELNGSEWKSNLIKKNNILRKMHKSETNAWEHTKCCSFGDVATIQVLVFLFQFIIFFYQVRFSFWSIHEWTAKFALESLILCGSKWSIRKCATQFLNLVKTTTKKSK